MERTAAVLRNTRWVLESIHGLEAMETLLGGQLEVVPVPAEVVLFANAEGEDLALPPSAVLFDRAAGTMEILRGQLVAFGGDSGQLEDATEATVQQLEAVLIPVVTTVTVREAS